MIAAERCLNKRRVLTVETLCITVFYQSFSFPITARSGTQLPVCPISREIKTIGDYVPSTKSPITRNKIFIAALGGEGLPPPPPPGHDEEGLAAFF
jgi:hypothetical protein